MKTAIQQHGITADEPLAAEQPIAWVYPATDTERDAILAAPENTGDGRSNWVWVRLYDGTLLLGVFPQGNTYMEFSDADVAPFGPK